ncbi:MAG: TRAP transporter large permease [Firmicutes bacterium]|nr:TRAP transporter large permease [Bacillota bacterium]
MFTLILVGLLVLVLLNVPLAVAIGLASMAYLWKEGIPFSIVAQQMLQSVDSFPFLAFPMFVLVGLLMNSGGISRRIFNFANVLVGHLHGGLGHVNVLASIIFAGMSGNAIADAGGLGVIEIKAMRDEGYDDDFSAAITAASSTIGPIIPPSIPMVIYAMAFEASIGSLFLGGIIPGLLMGLTLMITVYFIARKRNYPKQERRATAKEFWTALKGGFLPLLTPVILLGGIFSGIFTPTEAAAVAVVYSIILGGLVNKELKLREIPEMAKSVLLNLGTVLFILATVSVFTWILSREKVPDLLVGFISKANLSPNMFLLIANVILLILGCFTTITPAIILLGPIFLPIITTLGIDPVHFGVVMVLNLMIGALTPPVGPVVYVVADIVKLPFFRVFRATVPFLVPLLVTLVLITFFPQLVLFIPNMVGLRG